MPDLLRSLTTALVDRYSIERELGHGGNATVFLALDRKLERQVAIKVLPPELALTVRTERFLREIKIAARLTHPHIMPLHDSGAADHLLYYVMPYVAGESLRERLQREPLLPVEEAVRIAREVAEALYYAHCRGVVHRDIKPGNILLAAGQAVVADFGIARAISVAGDQGITDTGVSLGTPAYMSPEQVTSGAEIDGRSDIYSLGCVLYEMLAGEPPFPAPTAQAVRERHLSDPAPLVREKRPDLPENLENVVLRSLAKAPGGRFRTAAEFAVALDAAPGAVERVSRVVASPPTTAPVRPDSERRPIPARAVALVTGAVAIGLALILWRLGVAPPGRLDPQRLVVYPLAVGSQGTSQEPLGEDVASAILAALNSTGHLKAIEGWRLLDGQQRQDVRLVSERSARAIARRQRAGFYLEGQIITGDSIRLSLAVHDLMGGTTQQLPTSHDPTSDAWPIGLQTATALLPLLIPPGKGFDVQALTVRNPAATASFLNGERAFRRANFGTALQHYRRAVDADSAFALAALKGAQAASWNAQLSAAVELVQVALRNSQWLAPRDHQLARGYAAYYAFEADTAAAYFRRALQLDPEWPEAWAALGEVYTHLIPSDSSLYVQAELSLATALRIDPDFAPALYHLIEFALRAGDVRRATRLLRQFRTTRPDSAELVPITLMFSCVAGSATAVDWQWHTHRVPQLVVDAGRSLAVGGLRQPACAEAAWRAVLQHDTTMDAAWASRRWGALSGLQGILVATGRVADLRRLFAAETVFSAGVLRRSYILAAIAGADVSAEAESAAAQLRAEPSPSSRALWHLGIWEAHAGRAQAARRIADTLAARAARSGDREERLLARSIDARAVLASGDTTAALALLEGLTPTTGRTLLTWNPSESLGAERLLAAQVRLARGDTNQAWILADVFDSPAPVPYIGYVPASLALRMRAAEALRMLQKARLLRQRLEVLGRSDLVSVDAAKPLTGR